MLVLARRVGEKIIFDDGNKIIVVQLQDIDRKRAHLGIIAPREVGVFREEIYEFAKQKCDFENKSIADHNNRFIISREDLIRKD